MAVTYPPVDSLHPIQGSLPDLKLVSQPPLQLLARASSEAILAMTGPRGVPRPADAWPVVDGPRAIRDPRCDTTACDTAGEACGLAACFGASTVMSGSVPFGFVCDAAGPDSRTVDNRATAEGATRLDDNLMAMSSGDETPSRCVHVVSYSAGISGL